MGFDGNIFQPLHQELDGSYQIPVEGKDCKCSDRISYVAPHLKTNMMGDYENITFHS